MNTTGHVARQSARPASGGRCAAAAPRTAAAGRRGTPAPRRRAPCRPAAALAAAAISGKRCVISSSPRDHRWTAPPRLTSCARMPSHFHSICQSPSVARASRSASSSGDARKNGYGRERSSSVRSCERSDAYHSAVGVHSPISRAATVVGRQRGRLRQRAHDERLRHADAELAGQQLEQDEALAADRARATSR